MSPNPALLTWPRPVAGGGGGELSYGFVTSAVDLATGQPSWTFSGVSLGDAATDRTVVVVVGIRYGISYQVPSGGVTIGGIASTRVASYASQSHVSIHTLAVPTGTTADIVVTSGYSNNQGCSIGIYRVTGGALSVVDTYTGASPYNVDATSGGFVLAASNTNAAYTWTGDVTKDFERIANGWRTSGASASATSTANMTATSNHAGLMAAFASA